MENTKSFPSEGRANPFLSFVSFRGSCVGKRHGFLHKVHIHVFPFFWLPVHSALTNACWTKSTCTYTSSFSSSVFFCFIPCCQENKFLHQNLRSSLLRQCHHAGHQGEVFIGMPFLICLEQAVFDGVCYFCRTTKLKKRVRS